MFYCRERVLPLLIILNLCFALLLLPPYALNADISVSEPQQKQIPILMYHDILKSPPKQHPYVVSPTQLEQDLMYLRNNGYVAVTVYDLVAFVYEGAELPEKPILITFDDGYFNNVYYAQPLLEKYGMKATMFVVGAYCDQAVLEGEENPNYSYVMWERIATMQASGLWDIQSHTFNMHDIHGKRMGVQRKTGQTDAQYIEALYDDFSNITNKIEGTLGRSPIAFAYPYGAMDENADRVLKELGYRVTVCSNTGISTLTPGDPNCLFRLCRLARLNTRGAASLLK